MPVRQAGGWGRSTSCGRGQRVIPGARVGASLTIRTAERRLRLAVGVFLALVALVYFVTETRALLEQL